MISKFIGNSKTSNSVIILNHLDTSYGITRWELDALQRLVWKGKSMDVLNRVKNILSVVELKTRIAFPRKHLEVRFKKTYRIAFPSSGRFQHDCHLVWEEKCKANCEVNYEVKWSAQQSWCMNRASERSFLLLNKHFCWPWRYNHLFNKFWN